PRPRPGARRCPRRRHPRRPETRSAGSLRARRPGDRRRSRRPRHQALPRRAGLRPTDPLGKMFFNILATFAEFEVDLLRMRTREGMAVARAKGNLRGKQPKLSGRQQRELARMAAAGEYTIADLAEVVTISRATVYRPLQPSTA